MLPASLQVCEPFESWRRPGFRTPLLVVITRTQPDDSWMVIASKKRGSMLPCWDSIAEKTAAVSSGELLAPQPEASQEVPMTEEYFAFRLSQEGQLEIAAN